MTTDWKKRAVEMQNASPTHLGRVTLVKKLKAEGFTMSSSSVQRLLKRQRGEADTAKTEEVEVKSKKIEKEFTDNEINITAKSLDIRTLDDLLTESEVDLDVWEVVSHKVNSWEVTTKEGHCYTNYQVTAKMKQIVPDIAFEALKSVADGLKPRKVINLKHTTGETLYVPTLFDHHFGKLCWGEETTSDYDIKIADELWDKATAFGVQQAKMLGGIGKILLPFGSDLFHINNALQETGKGTKQDVDGRLAKIYRVAYRAVIRQVEQFAQIAPVEVVPVRGNHDPEMMMTVIDLLAAWFRNTDHIDVSTSLKRRSAHVWGDCFIGFCHGDEVAVDKLPVVFSTEFPEMWGRAKHRTILIGHWHKKKEMRYTTSDTYGNCVVHVCPSLSGTDDWHYSKGFIGDKVTENHLFSKSGKLATFEITASELMGGA